MMIREYAGSSHNHCDVPDTRQAHKRRQHGPIPALDPLFDFYGFGKSMR
jgi:hypothetical protein